MRAMPVSRVVTVVLLLLLVMLQYQLWTGRGSVHRVAVMKTELERQREANAQLEQDIARVKSEIQDLKEGVATVEEKARYEMGMVKPNEVFVQIAH